jgi:hypothetical protein
MVITKKMKTINIGEDAGEKEPLFPVGKNIN